jgi:hypothetical protein
MECPNRRGKGGAEITTTSKGRVYSLDGKKAKANNDLIAGMCYYNAPTKISRIFSQDINN